MSINYKYSFELDPTGPKGINIANWLNTKKIALIIIDIQNYITNKKYSGKYSSSNNEDYYLRIERIVLPNIKEVINNSYLINKSN